VDEVYTGFVAPAKAIRRVDRTEAIREAVSAARAGDIVLVAGKGHEPYQIIGQRRLEFDDREKVAEALRALGYGTIREGRSC